MEKIISLSDRRPPMPRRFENEPVEGKVLLFTGVRYERLEPAAPQPGDRPQRAKNK